MVYDTGGERVLKIETVYNGSHTIKRGYAYLTEGVVYKCDDLVNKKLFDLDMIDPDDMW